MTNEDITRRDTFYAARVLFDPYDQDPITDYPTRPGVRRAPVRGTRVG